MQREAGVPMNNDRFNKLVKRAKQRALLKNILISLGASLFVLCLVRR
ncbi:hypothetical protein [Planomicrobium sp. YIM 101495]|nr:hypothetical protein [Planomicrobium sp. YIM 101495]MTD31175.1 hypothetical protein [Planomicrobium sp. YIM 101495]